MKQALDQSTHHCHRAGLLPPQLAVHHRLGALLPSKLRPSPPAARSLHSGQRPACLRDVGTQQVLSHLGAQVPTLCHRAVHTHPWAPGPPDFSQSPSSFLRVGPTVPTATLSGGHSRTCINLWRGDSRPPPPSRHGSSAAPAAHAQVPARRLQRRPSPGPAACLEPVWPITVYSLGRWLPSAHQRLGNARRSAAYNAGLSPIAGRTRPRLPPCLQLRSSGNLRRRTLPSPTTSRVVAGAGSPLSPVLSA